MKNIILIGFMGTGKTVISKSLAKEFNAAYVSTDSLIEKQEGMAIKDIFSLKGESYFRQIEKCVIKEVCAKSGQIIDTGGGAIIDPENFGVLKENGIIICLWATPEVILKRTQGSKNRPLLNVENPLSRIIDILEKRREHYEKADFHIDTTSGDITDIVARILKLLDSIFPRRMNDEKGVKLWSSLLTRLLRSSDAPVMIINLSGKVLFANDSAKNIFCGGIDHCLRRYWWNLIDSEDKGATIENNFKKIILLKMPFKMDLISRCNNKEEIVHWFFTPINKRNKIFMLAVRRSNEDKTKKIIDTFSDVNGEILDILFSSSHNSEPDTARHSLRVMALAVALAKKIKMSDEKIETLKMSALFHDIGKLVVAQDILFKDGELNEVEKVEMKQHPAWSADMIRPVSFLASILPVVASHHENYDGTGYPNGMKGQDIPDGARIISIVDMYDALTTDRPYRKARDKKSAIEIMKEARGIKLDPELTDIFLEMLISNEIE
ncbi:metal dependent phosphohydrolase [Candidatus Omnitrophus magneticus]|uniref:Shikimate kinase n=1 Tax=Candidatus Omnitrophus magneticus TaxID=1609969 RepID=A0A0F0CRG2_9BACT|nr:metal dependent phosphohydrolase [Candidatus Omnitrophus magneticus]